MVAASTASEDLARPRLWPRKGLCSGRSQTRTPRQVQGAMALGYDGKLFILAFDHRGSFQKKMFGIQDDPTDEETRRIADAKHLIYEGMVVAADRGAEEGSSGVLVDEQFGGDIPSQAKERGFKLAMPVEKSGQGEGRQGVVCVVLGRGASDEKVDHWLRAGAPVEGYVGFAIGRSIWWDALKGYLDGSIEREDAASQIADNYLRFVRVYQEAESAVSAG